MKRITFRKTALLTFVMPFAMCLVFAVHALGEGGALGDPNAAGGTIEEGPAAVITAVTGEHVQYALDGESFAAAVAGAELGLDSVVRTGFGSACSLNIGSTTAVEVTALSSVKIADYALSSDTESINARLQYGAVRCGVEQGRVQADTKISTPVSTMSIRGTRVVVEYDPGTRRCYFSVNEHGPAIIQRDVSLPSPDGRNFDGAYTLEEGVFTDENMNRHLALAMFERASWGPGDFELGDISAVEAAALLYQETGFVDPTLGFMQYGNDVRRPVQGISTEVVDSERDSYDNDGDCPLCY